MQWKFRTSTIALVACAVLVPAAAAVAYVPDQTGPTGHADNGLSAEQQATQAAARPLIRTDNGLSTEQQATQAAARPLIRTDNGLSTEQQATQAAARLPFNGSLVAEQQAAEAADGAQQPGTLQPPTPSSSPLAQPAGFHWGDAGIGAGVVLALALLGAGGAFLLVRRREPQVSTGRRRPLVG